MIRFIKRILSSRFRDMQKKAQKVKIQKKLHLDSDEKKGKKENTPKFPCVGI